MSHLTRRSLLAGSAALLAAPAIVHAQTSSPKPRVTAISQWSAGSDGAAISALGKVFEEHGGIWQHNPVPGFTTEMMNKLRAEILAGDPPAISQLKGPEIAAWSKIAPTVDISPWVKQADFDPRYRRSLPKAVSRPVTGSRCRCRSIASTRCSCPLREWNGPKLTKPPANWDEFNEAATKMKEAGMTPLANGGIRWDDGMKFEIALAGIDPDIYRRAIMQLDTDALKSKQVLAAFEQTRRFANWMNPNIAAQSWGVNLPEFMKGNMGMVLMGGWAQGNLLRAGAKPSDFSSGPAPQDNGPPCFDLNADCFMFWKQKAADLQAGQKLFAAAGDAAFRSRKCTPRSPAPFPPAPMSISARTGSSTVSATRRRTCATRSRRTACC